MTRLIRGGGVKAASFSMISTGSNRGWVVPSAHSLFKVRSPPLRRERGTSLGDRRPEDVAGEPLERGAVVSRDGDVGVEIEPLEMRLARAAGGDPGSVGLAADLEDAGAGVWPERYASLHGSAADTGQGGRFLGERVGVRRVLGREPAAREEAEHAAAEGGDQPGPGLVARRGGT